jgi:hypothetical protein
VADSHATSTQGEAQGDHGGQGLGYGGHRQTDRRHSHQFEWLAMN